MTAPKPGTHCARLLAVLADGKPWSTSALHRRAGNMIVHSRVSELRNKGYRIEHEHVPGRVGARAHRYRWLDAPGVETHDEPDPLFTWDELAPRRPEERFRIYRHTIDAPLELIATCPSPESVGVALCTLVAEGEFDRAAVGVLDSNGSDDTPGKWIVNPWERGG